MLSFLLFAGAIHTDVTLLREHKKSILSFVLAGVLLSTFLIGGMLYLLLIALIYSIGFIYFLVFLVHLFRQQI